MRSDLRLLLVLAVATCGTGCAAAPDDALFAEAVRSFGREHSCPANRLQVKHAEVRLPDLVEPRQPPAEVAADAGRLAVWNQTVNQELASYERLTAVDVAGCGDHATYFCWYGHRIHRDHECMPVDLDDPHPDFVAIPLKPSAGQQVRQRLGLPPAPAKRAQPSESQSSTAAIQADIDARIRAREEEVRQRLNALEKETSATPPAPQPSPPPKR